MSLCPLPARSGCRPRHSRDRQNHLKPKPPRRRRIGRERRRKSVDGLTQLLTAEEHRRIVDQRRCAI